ncbi:DNA primase [Saccharicrinis sp. FJH62]|uniref:DNA primase n=1 Tax=Saccharicrinis sp. FJH62 TaxID=3344657 RepID=UPI0035D48F99
MIDQFTIEKIHDAARIEEVVSEYVTLKRRGVNFIGLCPFHDEKTPSFTVSPSKGICKCFGCGKGGNAVNFLMEVEQISYVEALRILAKKYNIEIQEKELTTEEKQFQNDRESMMVVNEFAAKYFSDQLKKDEGKAVGLSYFLERGFTETILEKFQLGYSPEKKDALTQEALSNGYKLDYLVKTGLTVKGENYQSDRFRGRVIFPIHGLSGKVLGFGGRILKSDAKTAKYLNSPESEVYHKSRVLYGIFHAKKEIVKQDRCYLVEGYTDVLSFHQSGIENVVASSGTALTPDQIRLISRFTSNITVIYDGDQAGINASIRGIDLILEQNINVKVLLLPDGEDPDSFAKSHSSTELIAYIGQNETDFIHFKTKLLLESAKGDPVRKAQLIGDIVKSIAIIPDGIIRSVYIKECSNLLDVREEVLYTEINKINRQRRNEQYKRNSYQQQDQVTIQTHQTPQVQHQRTEVNYEEYELIKYLVRYGNLEINFEVQDDKGEVAENVGIKVSDFIIKSIDEDDLQLSIPLYQKIFDLYRENAENEGFDPQRFFTNHAHPDVAQLAVDLTTEKHVLSKIYTKSASIETTEERLSELVPRVVYDFKLKVVQTLLNQKLELLKTEKDSEVLMQTMTEIQNLNEVKKQLGSILGGRIVI